MEKQVEKFAKVRADAIAQVAIPEEAMQIGVAEYAWPTAEGIVRVKFTAVKGDFDIAQVAADYAFEVEEKARVKAEKSAAKEKEKAVKIAAKEAKEAAKNA